jgi:hypothetical protein
MLLEKISLLWHNPFRETHSRLGGNKFPAFYNSGSFIIMFKIAYMAPNTEPVQSSSDYHAIFEISLHTTHQFKPSSTKLSPPFKLLD